MTKLPTYPWFDQVPDGLKTRNQLAELGLKPGGEVRAIVEWKRGKRVAYLYAVEEAVPKPVRTSAQVRATEEAKRARRTCPVCRRVLDEIVRSDTCMDCYDYRPDGTPRCKEGHFFLHRTKPYHEFKVWLPASVSLGPYIIETPGPWRYGRFEHKPVLHTILEWRDEAALAIPNHTHTWYFGPWFDEWIGQATLEQFLERAAQYPTLREWAVLAGLPKQTYMDYALAGLDEQEQASIRFFWYTEWTLYDGPR